MNGSKILFLGVAYKADINDARESPALKVMDEVMKKFARVSYYDPYIPHVRTEKGNKFSSIDWDMDKLKDVQGLIGGYLDTLAKNSFLFAQCTQMEGK